MIFKAIFAQVRAPRAKMAEKSKSSKTIDMAIFKVIVKVKIIFKVFVKVFVKVIVTVMTKIVGLDPQDPQCLHTLLWHHPLYTTNIYM